MRKMLLMLVAAVSLTVATVAAPSNAQAYCRGCWIGAGVAGAVIAGAAIANSAPYYGYGYGYRPAYPYYGPRYYGYAPAYYYGGYASRPYGYGGYGYRSPADEDGFGSGGYYSRW